MRAGTVGMGLGGGGRAAGPAGGRAGCACRSSAPVCLSGFLRKQGLLAEPCLAHLWTFRIELAIEEVLVNSFIN